MMIAVGASAESADVENDYSRIYLGSIPSVSHDGKFFVFEWCYRIWKAPVAGGEAVALTDGESREMRPYLSPDSKRVAFLSNRDGGWKLFEQALEDTESLKSGETRQLTFHTEGCSPKGYTSDGKSMLAVIDRDHAPDAKSTIHGYSRAAILPVSERGAEKIIFDAPAQEPSLSPDGTKLLFVYPSESREPIYRKRRSPSYYPSPGEIWLYDIPSAKFTKLVSRKETSVAPIWAPDAKGFYYMSDIDGVRNVYYHSLSDGKERQLTFYKDDHVFAPSVSKDGRTMVYRQKFDFWRIDPTLEKPVPERIVIHPAGGFSESGKFRRRFYSSIWNNDVDGGASFTNSGKELAFTTGGDLWVMDVSLRRPVRIHGSSRTHERDCVFTADGSALYYLSDRGDGVDVWKAERADPSRAWWENTHFNCTRLTADDVYRTQLSISPDGRRLGWVNKTGKIFFADTNAVVQAVSAVKASNCSTYVWSPDSLYVAASIGDAFGNNDVWIMPTFEKCDDGSPAPKPCNISLNSRWDGHPAWSADGKVVAFCGRRAKTNDELVVFYVYLNPADEAAENPAEKSLKEAREKTLVKKDEKKQDDKEKSSAAKNEKYKIVFDSLAERVRMTPGRGSCLFFAPDSRRLSFVNNSGTHVITIPSKLQPERVHSKKGVVDNWIKTEKGDMMLRVVDMLPAHGDNTFKFKVYQETNVADYQELAFVTAWADIRDAFCDPNTHGADWASIKDKYRLVARNAPCWSVFTRVMQMMIGELDGSHLGFWSSEASNKEWNSNGLSWHSWDITTAHIGARYDAKHTGEGWKVADVIPLSSVDRGENGLKAGDIILSVDGRKVYAEMDITEVMNVPMPHTFRIEYARNSSTGTLFAAGMTYGDVRNLMRNECIRATRRYVKEKGNFGYINIKAMNQQTLDDFMDNIFAEGFGKDGLIVDVRYNTGGYTADKILNVLCGPDHSRSVFRGDAGEGYLLSYWGRPVLSSLPIVVLCNADTASNGEIFSHAIKTMKRGKLVGVQTGGGVIATRNFPLLDMGTFRRAYIGWFTADGTDMEFNGAMPDVEVGISSEDIAACRDKQLDAAISELKKLASEKDSRPPLKYATWDEKAKE